LNLYGVSIPLVPEREAREVDLEPSLSDRVRELALDAEVEREALERRKAAALEEREAEVAKVRERYRVQLDAIEAELALADRLRRALDPEGAKRDAAAKRARVAAAKASCPQAGSAVAELATQAGGFRRRPKCHERRARDGQSDSRGARR
jgi:hypothetical protein